MKAKIFLVAILFVLSFHVSLVSATATNTSFSKSMYLEPYTSYRSTVDTSELYFSINPQNHTIVEFELEDTEGQYLEFCIYHGDSEEQILSECIGYETEPTTLTHSEYVVNGTYFVKITCSECELEGVNDVPFMIKAKYKIQPEYGLSSLDSAMLDVFNLCGWLMIVSLSVFFFLKVVKRSSSYKTQTTLTREEHHEDELRQAGMNLVQNITYNIQDSVITGDLEGKIYSTDDESDPLKKPDCEVSP